MTKAEVQTISDEAACALCVSDKTLMAMLVYLAWAQIHPGDPMTKAEVQTLTDNAACVADCASHKMLLAMAVYLLSVGGSGGGGAFTVISGSPEGVTTGDPGDRVWDDVGFSFWTKVSGIGTTTLWVPG